MTSGLLPERAQRILMEAAAKPATIGNIARREAVDKAIEQIKREFPAYFRLSDEVVKGGQVRVRFSREAVEP